MASAGNCCSRSERGARQAAKRFGYIAGCSTGRRQNLWRISMQHASEDTRQYAPTKVAVMLPVKRGLFQRDGLIVIQQSSSGSFAVPADLQRDGETWQEAAVRAVSSEIDISIPPTSLKLRDFATSPDGFNSLLCQSERIKLAAVPNSCRDGRKTSVITKPIDMETSLLTVAVSMFFHVKPSDSANAANYAGAMAMIMAANSINSANSVNSGSSSSYTSF
jgi:hypothetical protein